MADQKLSELVTETTISLVDYVYFIKDVGASLYESAGISFGDFFLNIWNTAQASPETSTTLTPAGGNVSLDFDTKINIVTLTANTEIQLPDMSGWNAGDIMRLDLYVKQDATGGYDFTWATGWKAAAATLPTNTTDPDAIDRYVLDCIKDLNVCIVGLAQADLS